MGGFDDLIPGGATSGGFDDLVPGGIGAKPKKRSIGDVAGDIGVTALKSAVGLPQAVVGLADIPTGGRVGKTLEGIGYRPAETQKTLDALYSAPQQAANKAVREADGFVPTLKAAIDNPSAIATTIGESLAQVVGGAGIARGVIKGGAAFGTKVPAWLAGAAGEGAIGAGSAAESMRAESEDGLLTGKQSLAAAGSGLGTAVLGGVGGKLAQRFGLGDVDTILTQGGPNAVAAGAAKQGFLKQVAGSGIAEGVFEELPQSVQEQMWQNYANDKPLTDGVGNAAAMGLLAGTALGGVAGGYNALARQPGEITPPTEDTTISGLLPAPINTGTPSDQVGAADVDRANAVAAAQANADALYKSRDEFEASQAPAPAQTVNPVTGEAFTPDEVSAFQREQSANQTTLARDLEIRRTMDIEAKAQLGTGALGRAASAGIDSGAITAEQILQPSIGVSDGTTGSDASVLAQEGGQSRSDLGGQSLSDVLEQPGGDGKRLGADAGRTLAGGRPNLPAGTATGGTDAVATQAANITGPSAADIAAASRAPLAGPVSISGKNPQIDSKPAAITQPITVKDNAKSGGQNPVARVGTTPKNAEDITVKDGVVYMGKFEVLNAKTAKPITVGENADFAKVKKALQDGGALTSKQKVYHGVFGSKAAPIEPTTKAPLLPSATSADITGKKIDSEWTAFDKSSGTLGINRAEMPQIKAEHRGAMVNFLNARGITSEQDEVSPDTLKATQREFSPAKVEKAKGFTGNDRSILVSSDGYVLDGHHQWLAKREAGKSVKVIRLNAPIKTLLVEVAELPSSQTANGENYAKPPSKLKAMIDARLANKEIRGLLPEFANLSGWSERGGSILRDATTGEVTGRTKWVPRADWWAGKPNSVTERLIRSGVPKALNTRPITKPEREAVEWLLSVIEADIAEMNRESVAVANDIADDIDDIPFDVLAGETDTRKQMEAMGFSQKEIDETLETDSRKTEEDAARSAQEGDQPGSETQATEADTSQVDQDRRQNAARRKNITDMTPDEMRRELLIDAMTGLGNRRAYEESTKLATQVSIDADGLKWINDNLGHESGDRLLETIGKVIAEETDNGYHISGDEYVIQTHTKEEANAIMARVVERLDDVTIESSTTDGEVITMRGIGISYGVNGDLNNAEKALREHKAQREREGLRGGRGAVPPNAIIGKEGRQDQQNNDTAEEEKPGLSLTGQTSAEIAAAEAASKKAAEKSAREDAKPTGPDVTADQVDLFATQNSLFNSNRNGAKPKPKNMAGEVRQERTKPNPTPGFESLHPKAQEKFSAAWDAKDVSAMQEYLDPANKGLRAEFESRSGDKLPKTVSGTDKAVADYFAQEAKPEAAPENPIPELTPLEAHKDLFDRATDGSVTADEFKAAYAALLASKDAITAELDGMTKAQLFERYQGLEYRYKNEKKADLIAAVYRSMVTSYTLSDTLSYGMGKNAMEDAIQAIVDNTTDQKMADYASEVQAAVAERIAKRKETMAGVEDPKTLADFENLMRANRDKMDGKPTFQQIRMTLTPEQRAQYDILAAEKSRGERGTKRDNERTHVSAAGATTGAEIIATKHTRDGYDLFVVKAAERVERDVYNAWNAAAKKLGGWYSAFKGNGATPGFQFKTRESAEAFQKYVSAGDTQAVQDQAKARRDEYADDRSQTAVERLTEMADSLEGKADASLNQERKENTDKRARQAASAEAAANSEKAMAQTMRNIAKAIQDGKAKLLDRVRQKVQVETLRDFMHTAQSDKRRALYPSYAEQEKHRSEKPNAETADYVTFPTYTAFRSDLASLGRALLETEGTKKLGQRMMKVADDVSDAYLKFAKENLDKVSSFRKQNGALAAFPSKAMAEAAIKHSGHNGKAIVLPVKRNENVIILSPSEAIKRGVWTGDNDNRITLSDEFGAELVEKIGKAARRGNKISVPWQFESAYDKRKRLAGMGIETPAELRAAVREFIALREAPKEADKIKEMERAMIGRRNDGMDFFPTPASVADEMVETAGIQPGMSVLEPSAGMGHIAERIREAGVDPDVVELAIDRRELLEAKGFRLVGNDFMDINPREFFTYGDTFKAADGTEGVMRGPGGMGSNRVRLVIGGDERAARYVDRDDLTGTQKNGVDSGYDRILMNPPFSDGRSAQHVQHAYELLKPGGRLVALMDEGVFFRSDKKAQAFRDWMQQVGATDEKLDKGTFLDPSLPVNTGVNARMVVIDKPGPEWKPSDTKETDTGTAMFQPDGTYADPYQTIEVRPNTAPKQLSAGRAALNDAERRIFGQNMAGFELLGSRVSADFRANGGTSLIGQEVNRPEDLAFAAQVLRDPRFETFRVFYTDATGKIIGERAYSSRLAGAVYLPDNMPDQIHIDIRAHGATGYWMLHNHPSGSAAESKADLNLTASIAKKTRGFIGHVVIDHNEYNHISVEGGIAVPNLVSASHLASINLNANPEKAHPLLGESVSGPPALAEIAKRMQTKDGYVVLIGTDGQQRISLLTEVPASYLKGIRGNKLKGLRAVAAIKRATGETGSINLFAAVPGDVMDYGVLIDSGVLRDVVSMNGGESASTMGLLAWKGIPVSNVARSGGKGYVAQPNTPYRTNEPIWSAPTDSRMDTFLYEVQDKHIDTKRVIESIKTKINDLADEFNTYVKEALYHGRADKRTKDFLTDELTPLVDAMTKDGVTQTQLNEYLHARHAIERNRVMRERNPDREDNADLSGMSDDKANEILKKSPLKLVILAKRVDAIVAKSRQELVEYGLETQETVDAWSKLYKHYVPLKREGFDDAPGTGSGFSVRGSSTKEAVGSHRAVDNIFANIAMQRERNLTRGEKNRVALSLYGLAKTNLNAGFWKLDKPAQITQINAETGLPEVVPGDMADYKVPMVSYLGKDGTVQMRVDPAYKGRDNVVTVRIGGVDHAVIFNESDPRALRMAESLKNLDMDQLGEVIGSVARVTRYIAAVNTQYNPVFGVTNLLRDVQTAMLNLQSTPLKGKQRDVMKEAVGALKGIYQDARAVRRGKHPDSEYAKDWEEFQGVGGQTGYRDMFRTAKDRAAEIEHMLDPAWWQKTYAGKLLTLNGVLAKPEQMLFNSVGKHLFRWLEDYNTSMENAMRLAAYRVGKRNGMSQEAAAFLAKSLTVNFNKKGRVATQAGALYAFFNASAQGTARIAETLRYGAKPGEILGKTGKAIITGGITLGAMQALLLLAAGFDEDEPPEFIRERNLIIPAPGTDKGYITIPMPLGFHVLPNIGRVLVEGSVYGKPLDRMADLMLTLFEAFNPIGTGASLAQTISPTVADPIVALAENKDWTGKRIFREDFSQLDPTPGFTRTKDNASILAKGLAYGVNAITGGSDYTPGRFSPTPDQIDYLIGQATGGVGREVTKAATTAGALITGEELPTYKIPLVGRLIGSAGGESGVRDKFYDNLRTLNLHEAEIQGRRDKREPVLDYLADHPEARLAKYAGRVESKIREKKRLSKQAKEDGRDNRLIDAQIVNMMKQLNERVLEANP